MEPSSGFPCVSVRLTQHMIKGKRSMKLDPLALLYRDRHHHKEAHIPRHHLEESHSALHHQEEAQKSDKRSDSVEVAPSLSSSGQNIDKCGQSWPGLSNI